MGQAGLVICCLVMLVIPVFLTRWSWFWTICGIFATPLIVLWGLHFYVLATTPNNGSSGSSLGLAILGMLTISLATGMILRYLRWIFELIARQSKRTPSS